MRHYLEVIGASLMLVAGALIVVLGAVCGSSVEATAGIAVMGFGFYLLGNIYW